MFLRVVSRKVKESEVDYNRGESSIGRQKLIHVSCLRL